MFAIALYLFCVLFAPLISLPISSTKTFPPSSNYNDSVTEIQLLPSLRPPVSNGSGPFISISASYVPRVHQEAPMGGVNQFSPTVAKNRSGSIPDGRVDGLSGTYGGGQMQAPIPPPPYSANLPMGQNGQMGDGIHHYFPVAAGSSFSPTGAGDITNVPQYAQQYSYPPGKIVRCTSPYIALPLFCPSNPLPLLVFALAPTTASTVTS